MQAKPASGWFSAVGNDSRRELAARLFGTHKLTCDGTDVFCELFLNLRGGLSPSLADEFQHKDSHSLSQRKSIVRGIRRVLSLCWLSVEDAESAEAHEHRIPAVTTGCQLEEKQATTLLSQILRDKGVTQDGVVQDWCDDCIPALTARVRTDSIWINRHRAFSALCPCPTPIDAHQILTKVFGSKFVSLELPAEVAESDDDPDAESEPSEDGGGGDESDPSNKGRAIFCDLFGQGPKADFDKTGAFAAKTKTWIAEVTTGSANLREDELISSLPKLFEDDCVPAFPSVELKKKKPKKTLLFVPETVSGKRISKLAVRFRKLLVRLRFWDQIEDETGSFDESLSNILKELSKACDEESKKGDRVLNPEWGKQILQELQTTTRLRFENIGSTDSAPQQQSEGSPSEFGYLMAGLAARRVSQTHSWMKRNELQRHVSALKAVKSRDKLRELDPNSEASAWLRSYESEREKSTGAEREYMITRRAIAGIDEVVSAISTADSDVAREAAIDRVQSEVEKFGDHDLFREMANAKWVIEGKHTCEIVKAWVALRQSAADERRWKIPRFCHPDPFRHPTFCEFGDNSKPKVQYAWCSPKPPASAEQGGSADDKRCFWLQIPNVRGSLNYIPIRWRSKRLWNDFGGDATTENDDLSRNNRVGIADGNLTLPTRPGYPFSTDSKGWNARLQAPRDQLRLLAEVWNSKTNSWTDAGKRLARINWFLTFSPDLVVSEKHWSEYIQTNHEAWEAVKGANQKPKREGRAKLGLCRLPGLRLLSVDLGHRYAAACAVWEALGHQVFRDELALARKDGAEVCFGPLGTNEESAVYCHVKFPERVSKKATKKAIAEGRDKFQPVTVYRRIGSDALPDGSPHPAPWARLDRQFLVKLQGEDQPARAATLEERECVETLERELGHQRREPRKGGEWRIDELMSDVVRIVRLALYQHGDYARLASGLIATDKLGMGNRSAVKLAGEALDEHLLDLLERWHELAHSPRWTDTFAREKWQQHIAPRLGDKSLAEVTDDMTGPQRKATKNQLRGQLEPLAKQLAKENLTKLAAEWQQAWDARDQQWHKQLRSLNRWIMPRGKDVKGNSRKGDHSIRRVGGLSLNRIATFKSLYQVQKAFFTRLKPDGKKPDPAGEDFGQRTLMAMERMRQNRVKQLASRIAEAALGVGIEGLRGDRGRQLARPRERIAGPRFAPCHAVVIENLTHYKPDELQTRRENRQLMTWAAAQVKKHLSDQCQLHGLHLREVQPGYTSRQDSRTGAPGVRCNDIRVEDFPRRCARQLTAIAKKGANDPLARYLLALKQKYLDQDGQPKSESLKGILLRIPQKGGELFVSASAESSAAHGLQADLNAAANIGLRALLDPDWSGSWWYVPATRIENGDFTPKPESTSGSVALNGKQLRLKVADTSTADSATTSTVSKPRSKSGKAAKPPKGRDTVNLWCDVSTTNLDTRDWLLIGPYTNVTSEQVAGWLHAHDDREGVVESSLTNEDNPF